MSSMPFGTPSLPDAPAQPASPDVEEQPAGPPPAGPLAAAAGAHLLAEPAGSDEEVPGPLPHSAPAIGRSIGPYAPPRIDPADEAPFVFRLRFLQAIAGAVLLTMFLVPWNRAHSWELLTVLRGADFVRQLLLLISGGVLFSMAILPVPAGFRAALGALLSLGALSLGGMMLSPVQGLLSVLVMALLPAALLVRAEVRTVRLPQLLGLAAVVACLALYLAPRDGVRPLSVAVELVTYRGDDMARFIGTYLLLPLPLICLATVALIGADVAVIGELLCWLFFFWGPGAILVLAIDRTQVYMASAVLAYSVCAGYGCAELLRRVTVRLWLRQSI